MINEGNNFKHRIKIDNSVIDNMLKNRMKRSLFIYIYLLSRAKGQPVVSIDFAEIAGYLELKTQTNNIKTIKQAVNHLIEEGLVDIHADLYRETKLSNVDDIKTNTNIYITVEETRSEEFYTLIEMDIINKVYYQKSDESKEDMIALLALLCRQIERREEVLEVAWFSQDKIVAEIGIQTNRYKPLIEEMKMLKIIYFDKAKIGKKEHYIYGMFDNAKQVKQAIEIAEKNRKLDVRVKMKENAVRTIIDADVDKDTGEIIYLPQTHRLHNLMINIGFELNEYTSATLNELAERRSEDEIVELIERLAGKRIEGTDVYSNIIPLNNPTGYIVNGLRQAIS